MEIIGNGFIAGQLRAGLGNWHPDTTVIAAGVSDVSTTSIEEFQREASLVHEEARRCRARGRTVVFFSTSSTGMYGSPYSPGTEDGAVFPSSAYGRHKLGLERMLAGCGGEWLVLRLSHLVGSGQQEHQLLPALSDQVRSGSVTLYRGASRDLLDVRHMVTILNLLLRRGVSGRVVNVASGVSEPVERIVSQLELCLGTTAERRMLDVPTQSATVSIARLRRFVPEVDGFGFGPEYLPRLLDRYISGTR